MRRINYKSDFDFVLKLKECKGENQEAAEVPFPDCDWEAVFYTSTKANSYTASCKGGEYVNCFKDEGGIHLVFNDHRMGVGTLKWEPHFELPNDIYPDSIQDLFSKQQLGIELVNGPGDCPTTAEVAVLLPYIKGEPFTFEDFTPEQIEDLQKPAAEAAERLDGFVKTASESEAARELNEQSRVSAESERVSQEELRQTAESARQSNETAREAAEAKRAEAEDARRTAETERAAEFATWETELDGKQDKLSTTTDLHITDDNIIGLTELAKMRLFIDRWTAEVGKWGCYNEATGYFELNGIRDITYQQALQIMDARYRTYDFWNSGRTAGSVEHRPLPRTTIPFISDFAHTFPTISWCEGAEVIRLCGADESYPMSMKVTAGAASIIYGSTLTAILDRLVPTENVKFSWTNPAGNSYAPNLSTLYIYHTAYNVDCSLLHKLSMESVVYMVENAQNTRPITITLHPTVYALLKPSLVEDATAKQITFATTE